MMKADIDSLVLIGETGVGKSTLGNEILGLVDNGFVTGNSLDAITQKCTYKSGLYLGTEAPLVTVIDTQGYNDPQNNDKKNAEQMIKVIKDLKKVKAFFLIFNGDIIRWNEATWSILNLFNNMFPNFWENLIIIVNFWRADEYSKKLRSKTGRNEGFMRKEIAKNLTEKYNVSSKNIRISFLNAVYLDDIERENFRLEMLNNRIIFNSFKPYETTKLEAQMKESDIAKQKAITLAAEKSRLEQEKRTLENKIESDRIEIESLKKEKEKKEEAAKFDNFPIKPDRGWYYLNSSFIERARVVVGGWVYKYRIEVEVKRSCSLRIKDGEGDIYSLWCKYAGEHHVDYNSGSPSIYNIWEV